MIAPIVSKQGCWNRLLASLLLVSAACEGSATLGEELAVSVGRDGRLVYQRDAMGNRVPDFSHCGYAGADRDFPDVPVRAVVEPAEVDNTARIQAAINHVAQLPLGPGGFRGAVLLAPGRFEVAGQLRVAASGVVLRGSGAGEHGTTVVATGLDRRTLVSIAGVNDRRIREGQNYRVIDRYVPVGAVTLRLDSTEGLNVGDEVLITRPSTAEWIGALGMDAFGVAWKPGTRDIRWDRTVVAMDGDTITLDAPITTAIEERFGGAAIERYDWPGRIAKVGVEDLRLQSEYDVENRRDEEHAWFGVTMENTQDAWVRRVEFCHFAGGAVVLWETTKRVTVEDCISRAPISERGGYRRHTFFTQGQLALFLRCWSEEGRHDFAVGHCAPGPNAFVNCYAADARGDSGPIESWASGVLYDNVRIEGADLALENRWSAPPGAGWSAANCVLWQCQAATVRNFRPPTAANWAIGVWGEMAGDGSFAAVSDFVRPISLYQAQLRDRRGAAAAKHVSPGLVDPIGSTNPTLDEAVRFAKQSRKPARHLIDVIRERWSEQSADDGVLSAADESSNIQHQDTPTPDTGYPIPDSSDGAGLRLENGWFDVDGRLKTGGLRQQGFWRGTVRPDETPEFGPAITRFVPGRTGTGFTDGLANVADAMVAGGVAVFDHHYGLWYDRRRDDHTMVRRADGGVAPPFLEQPFARTGRDKAWDGLSKYDLTRFNPWYWRRLREFATLCDERGLVLFHQNYFQHNLLEAGAHWADCPWRPANNVNDTGLPEPPPYVGDKRIFLAANFYHVNSNAKLHALHRGYIRQCLDNFAGASNVVQMTSAEYSGPLEFTQFWLDTIIEWKHERQAAGKPSDVIVALSAPKDVQDAILADPERTRHVDMIDIRYWAYTENDELYAPPGGQHLAPRQHLRQTRQKPGGFAAVVKAVREYRARFPDKAITYYADMHCPSTRDGWAVLIGGGSLPDVKLPDELAVVVPSLTPAEDVVVAGEAWCLANRRGDCLFYTAKIGESLSLKLPLEPGSYRIHWIDVKSGTQSVEKMANERPLRIEAKSNAFWLEPQYSD